MTKKLKQVSHNVGNSRLVNTVAASFDTTMGQMTEMCQRKNRLLGMLTYPYG